MEACISRHGVQNSRDACCLGAPFWPYDQSLTRLKTYRGCIFHSNRTRMGLLVWKRVHHVVQGMMPEGLTKEVIKAKTEE